MDRHHSRTIAPKPPCRELALNGDSDELAEIVDVASLSAKPISFGRGTSVRGRGNALTNVTVDQEFPNSTAPLDDDLQTIRRTLWILNATLDSLIKKIEMMSDQSGMRVEKDLVDRAVHTRDRLAEEGFALEGKKILGWRPARWKCARLRARAVRAERHAAISMSNASASLSRALDAVLQYARARAKADESRTNVTRSSTPRSSSEADE
jgi:hypothetical protein